MTNSDSKGNEFLGLLDQNEQRIRSYIFALVPNYADAQEIAQQVRMLMWEQFDEFDREKDFGVWARAIAYYQILSFRTKMGRNREYFSLEFLEKIAEKASQVQTNQLYEERTEALRACIEKLTDDHRELLLKWYEGSWSLKQIAKQIDKSYSATRKAMMRIRTSLSNCIRKELKKEGVGK